MIGNNQYSFSSPMERFLANVLPEPNSGCWLWLGCLNRKGYAQIGLGPKVLRAHRFAFELFRGPLSASLDIDHLCRVRCCVNPHHLEPVTHRENCKRGKLGEK